MEAHGFEAWLGHARDVRHLAGRPKPDTLDAVWLAKLAERQLLRPSFVPPRPIRQLRAVARYRVDLVGVRTAEKQRAGAGCWRMPRSNCRWWPPTASGVGAGQAGRRARPKRLAQLARTRLGANLGPVAEACSGCFTDQHAFRPAKLLGRVDALDADLAELDAKIQALIVGFAGVVERLEEIPGIGQPAAQLLVAELGTDMTRVPTAGHLVSWASYAPGRQRVGRQPKGTATTGHGNPYLARVLGEAAVAATKTNTFLGERDRRITRRRGTNKAIVAVGRSILVIGWQLLADPQARYHDLGVGFYDTRIGPDRATRNHLCQLQALGDQVILEPAA